MQPSKAVRPIYLTDEEEMAAFERAIALELPESVIDRLIDLVSKVQEVYCDTCGLTTFPHTVHCMSCESPICLVKCKGCEESFCKTGCAHSHACGGGETPDRIQLRTNWEDNDE